MAVKTKKQNVTKKEVQTQPYLHITVT